jgi:hypothetical protein
VAAVGIIRNIGLDDSATSTQTSTVDEPTAAAHGDQIFLTGNWFSSHSLDGGATWSLVDPFSTLPSAAGGFCCDQITLFDGGRGLWIWILQYLEEGSSNVFRVAVGDPANFGAWTFWDISPLDLDPQWTDMWFDYPDAATSDNHLYITFNAFNTDGNWLRSFVFKLPLADLAAGQLTYQWWTTTTHGSLRLTQGATSDMFFASHNASRRLRVFRWPDASDNQLLRREHQRLEPRAVLGTRAWWARLARPAGLSHHRVMGGRRRSGLHVGRGTRGRPSAPLREGRDRRYE